MLWFGVNAVIILDMNSLVIPPSPNWYEASILACAPDNTLVYGARNEIVVLGYSSADKPADIKIIPRAHLQKIVSVSLNKNWGQPNKLLVTASEDRLVKLWSIDTLEKKVSHSIHKTHNKVIGATFAGDERIISVSEDGIVVVWNVGPNQTNVLKDLFNFKVTITAISTCPHANWLTAFGLKNGLVVITDLRKQGKVLYKLRGHDKSVLSLTWCPAPINIFPKDPHNFVGPKKSWRAVDDCLKEVSKKSVAINDDNSLNKESVDENEEAKSSTMEAEPKEVSPLNKDEVELNTNETKPKEEENISSNKKGVEAKLDDDELSTEFKEIEKTHPLLKTYDSGDDDFLKECERLKDKILEIYEGVEEISPNDRPVLKARKLLKDDTDSSRNESVEIREILNNEKKDEVVDKDNIAGSPKEDEALNVKEIDKDSNTLNENMEENIKKDEGSTFEESNKNIDTTNETDDKIDGNTEADGDSNIRGSVEDENEADKMDKNIKDENSISQETKNANTIIEDTREPHSNDGQSDHIDTRKSSESGKIGAQIIENLTNEPKKIENDTTSDELKPVNDIGEKSTDQPKREIPVNIPMEEEPRREYLLASSGREGHIYIWRAGQIYPDKMWIVLNWVTPNILLSSSKSGELLQWNLPKPKDKSKLMSVVHNDHSTLLFSICAPISILNEYNWLDVEEKKLNVWTIGQDRLLLNTSLSSERKNLACYPTVGVVECFVPSPLDPTRLAIGTGEGIIKIWDLSRPHVKNIIMTDFYQKIQSKVLTLAWHPTERDPFSFRHNGRTVCYLYQIGFLDINNKSKSPTLLPSFFKSHVHKIEWGPLKGNKQDLGVFAVAEGKLGIFSSNKSEEPQELDTPDNTYVYTFSWKPDYETLLVSSKTGTLMVYSSDLNLLSTHYLQSKIQMICWHPDAAQNDLTVSKYCHWFASVVSSKEIVIYDLSVQTEDDSKKIVARHKARDMITCIAWSPHDPSQLIVAVDDGTAEVLEVETDTVLSTYVNANFETILAVTWSPIEKDYILSAGKDHTIRIWRISDHSPKTDEDISEMKKKIVQDTNNGSSELPQAVEKLQDEPAKAKKSNKNNLLPVFYSAKDTTQTVADLRKLLSWKEGLYDIDGDGRNGEESDLINIFGSNEDMLKIINRNETSLKSRGKHNLLGTLSLFKGDISSTIKEAIDKKRVNSWIIMMAPMVSPKLWKTACEVYARQLSEETDTDPIEIATYFLACHKVQEAINVLCDRSMFREALALAKSRLPENDPGIKKIIELWASYSLIVGNFETGAQCNIVLGKYGEAASMLFRRSDPEILEFAMELAKKSGNEELYKAVLFRYNAFKAQKDEAVECENETNGEANIERVKENGVVNGSKAVENGKDLNRQQGVKKR
ncbi:hypothetical protein NQ317_003519 [Molorchus minor]|uniref:Gem-associated protein 5 n=1 Tax=Molorchus minor TaxID=1323400 RepID=A0ABQ9K2S2_9CUCU|nr:hypothetical protein NQ317_003519 [Molorchus minor]